MTDPRRQAWLPYIRDIADRLRLRDWNVSVTDTPPDDPESLAANTLSSTSRSGRVHLSDDFLGDTPEEQRQTIVHEVLHCHFGHAYCWAAAYLPEGPARDAFTRMHEIGIDGLADAIAPLMPLPGDVAATPTNGRHPSPIDLLRG